MARREVIEIICDRCKRVETQAPSSVPDKEKVAQELIINFHGKKVVYDDLCRKCRKTVSNYYDKIIKAPEEEEPTKKPEETPTPEPAPKGGLFRRSKATG